MRIVLVLVLVRFCSEGKPPATKARLPMTSMSCELDRISLMLRRLNAEGRIRAAGLSNFTAAQIDGLVDATGVAPGDLLADLLEGYEYEAPATAK